jgi:hypothetical protein
MLQTLRCGTWHVFPALYEQRAGNYNAKPETVDREVGSGK